MINETHDFNEPVCVYVSGFNSDTQVLHCFKLLLLYTAGPRISTLLSRSSDLLQLGRFTKYYSHTYRMHFLGPRLYIEDDDDNNNDNAEKKHQR